MSRSSYIIAGVAVLGIGGWLASGTLLEEEAAPEPAARTSQPQAPLVEVAASRAELVTRHIIAQGDVQAFRRVAARTQGEGRIDEIFVSQGERVQAGQPLVRLTLEGRGSRLREARAVLEQRRQDYEAAATLLEQGYTSASSVRELRTALESAREEVQRLEEEVADTTVRAPFDGVVDAVDVEPGEYVTANVEVATLIDNSPLRTSVRVNQQDISRIDVGREGLVSYATGQEEIGRVCFVSAAADTETRTFRVEIRTPNTTNAIPSGISAEARIPTGQAEAHFVSPAILSLGTNGDLGVKTVDGNGTVSFHNVNVVRAQTDGVWVSGLPEEALIITIGQGFVQAGDTVRVAEAEASAFAGADLAEPPSAASGVLPDDICDREPGEAIAAPDGGVAAVPDPAAAAEADEPDETVETMEVPVETPDEADEQSAAAVEAGEAAAGDTGDDDEPTTIVTAVEDGETEAVEIADPAESRTAANDTPAGGDGPGERDASAVPAIQPAPALIQPNEPETVERVQRALNRLGYEAGPVDGVRGEQTLSALRAFQEEEGIEVTGELDSVTVGRIIQEANAEVASGDAP